MELGQRDKEFAAAIGASIGWGCRFCAGRDIPAGRETELSEADLAGVAATAPAVRGEAMELLVPRLDEFLGHERFLRDGVRRGHLEDGGLPGGEHRRQLTAAARMPAGRRSRARTQLSRTRGRHRVGGGS